MTDLLTAFAEYLRADEAHRVAETRLIEVTKPLQGAVTLAEKASRDAWAKVEAIINETGEYEATLPGDFMDYRIYRTTPRESVKVESVDALPEQFVKTEKKPKLKEIGDHLKELRDAGLALPNYATLERGEGKLTWEAKKKKATPS